MQKGFELSIGILILIVLVIAGIGGGIGYFAVFAKTEQGQPVLNLQPQNVIVGQSSIRWNEIVGAGEYWGDDIDEHIDSRNNPHKTVLYFVLNQRDFNIVNADVNDFAEISSDKINFSSRALSI